MEFNCSQFLQGTAANKPSRLLSRPVFLTAIQWLPPVESTCGTADKPQPRFTGKRGNQIKKSCTSKKKLQLYSSCSPRFSDPRSSEDSLISFSNR